MYKSHAFCPVEQLKPWKARWSWITSDETNDISAIWARTEIDLGEVPVTLQISASHIYRLWWNGAFIAQESNRTDPRYLYGNTHRLTARPGLNEIVVLIYHFKAKSDDTHRNWCLNDGPPGLIAEIIPDKPANTIIPLDWKMRRSKAWNPAAPLSTMFRGPIHDVDMEVYAKELQEALDGKDEWTSGVTFEFGSKGFYPEPMPNEIPRLRDEILQPLTVTRVLPTADAVSNHRSLFGYMPENVLTATPRDGGPWLIFEFAEEFTGFPLLEIEGKGVLDIYYGEGGSLGHQDRIRLSGNREIYEGMDWRGGRFLALNCSQMSTPLKVIRLNIRDRRYPFEDRGSFRCESSLWNKIWKVCRETARTGVREFPFDCAREQALWLEDAAIHTCSVRACFGDLRAFRKGFLMGLRPMHEDGLVPIPGPATLGYDRKSDLLRWATFPLALPRILKELLFWEPDPTLAEWALPKLNKMLDFLGTYQDDRGLVIIDPQGKPRLDVFVGWNPSQHSGVDCGSSALYLAALDHAAQAAEVVESKDYAEKWNAKAKKLRKSIFETFWMPERMLFSNGENDGKRAPFVSPTVNGWCALTGLLPKNAAGSWAEALVKDPMLLPFMSSYDATIMLTAFAHLGIDHEVKRILEGYYGSIIRANEPYIPEYWLEHGKTSATRGDDSSRCHPFGSGPAFVLHEYVLGVKAIKPGWSEISVDPHPVDLWHASGTVPSPLGEIIISWDRTDSTWSMDLEIPAGMTAHIRLPRFGVEQQELRVNGHLVAKADFWPELESLAIQKNPGFCKTMHLQCTVAAGRHRIVSHTV